MEISLLIEEEGSGRSSEETVAVEESATIGDVLDEAGINPETVLVEHDDAIVPVDAAAEGMTELRVLQVVSGG